MILSAIAARLKQHAKADFWGRHFEAALIVQAISWYLRYPLSYRDIEEMLLERGLEVDHSTINRWVLAYAPLVEKRLRKFRRPHCGSVRIDETYIKVRGQCGLPPEKWSSLRYGFEPCGGRFYGTEEAYGGRDRRKAASSRCLGLSGPEGG